MEEVMFNYKSCTKIALALLVTLLVSGTAIAQNITDYTFIASSGTFTPLTGATVPTLTGGSNDDGYYDNLPIGFTFNYLGVGYTIFSATTNGAFVLGSAAASSMITNNLTSGTPRPVLAPLWDDLDQETFGTFSYKTEGTAPNQVFTAEWLNFAWNYTATVPVVSFQVKLYEANGSIEFIYRDEPGAITGTPSASIGISAVGTGAGNFLSLDGTGSAPNASSTVETTTLSSEPATGQIYAFVTYPFPTITHTPLENTFSSDARLVSAVITSTVGLAGVPNQPRMYYRAGTSGPYTAVVMTNTTGDTWQATIPGQAPGTFIQYYIAAQDTSVPPLVKTAPAGGSGYNPPGTTPPATPYQYLILAPLVGGNVYPINGVQNAPVSFSDLTNVAAYLTACGITGTGQVILELSTGYTGEPAFPVTFSAIPGASATLGVMIRPATGTSPFTIEGSGTSIINFDGVSYVTIDGRPGGTGTTQNITISNTSTAGSAVLMTNAACYNTIKYSMLKACGTSSYGVVYISTSTGPTGNDYNKIGHCDITASASSPYYGVRIYGSSGYLNTGNTISNCNIYDFSNTAVYIYSYCDGTEIKNNDIYTLTQQTSSTLQGIDIHASTSGGSMITNNKIRDFWTTSTSPTLRGIYLYYGSTADVTTIANNFICIDGTTTHPGATIYGIYDGSGTGYKFDIYYNAIYIGGTDVTGGSSRGLYRGYATIMNIKNNIVFNNRINSTGTGKHHCFYASNTTAGLISNNNDFYAPNANGYVGYWTADRLTLADWKLVSGQDANSVSQDPNYVNVVTTDLHINPAIATRLESGGVPIAGITTDIDGDTRAGGSKIHNNVQPDIGADEFNGIALDEMPPAITYTPLVSTPYTTNRTLTATITDFVSGIANDPARAPRLFYKKGDAGTWVADTVLTPVGNDWTFDIDHSLLGGVMVSDTVFYYVEATDSSNNTGTNPFGGAAAPNFYTIIVSMAGNYNIGTGQTYPTLKDFCDAINNSAIIGNITGTITSDLNETMTDTINQLNYFGGTWTVTIIPAATKIVYTVERTSSGPLVYLNGADNIVFNGMGKNLRFRNTSTSGKVFEFWNDATYNTITSCILEGCGTSTSYPTIRIYTSASGTTGNSYNTISDNDIRDLSTSGTRQYVGIYAYGTSAVPNHSNTISNNYIFNYSYYGIYISSYNTSNWIISGNSFYYNNTTAATSNTYAIYFYPSSVSDDNLIYGNFIGGQEPYCGGTAWTYAYAGYFYSIYVNVGTTNPTIVRKNTIKNITLTSTGTAGLYGIYMYSGAAIIDSNMVGDPAAEAHITEFVNNRIPDFNISPTNHNGLLNYDIQPPDPSHGNDILNANNNYAPQVKGDNRANSIVNNGAGVIRGIYIGSSVAVEVFVENNEICNIASTNTGTSAYINGIYNGGGATSILHIWNNRIHDLTVNSAATSLTAPAIAGIAWFPGTTTEYWAEGDIVGNTIYSLVDTNMTAVSTNVMGMMLTNCAADIVNNHVYDIRNQSTGTTATAPPTATAFYIRYQSGSVVANNMASVGDGQATNTQFHAYWNGAGSNNNYVMFYNSGLVTGAVASGDLPSFAFMRGNNDGATAITTEIYARNNIFVNNRTGGTLAKHYAIGNQVDTATAGWDFDYNILKSANSATLGLWGITDLTFNDWKTATGGDDNSINADPGYMSVTDLHISPTSLVPNRKATPIPGGTFDFDWEDRHPTNPDIGADEYTPDAPNAFALISPANGAITQPVNGELVWHAAALGEFYDVYLDVVNPPVVKVSTFQSDTTYAYSAMPNMTYYWQVVAHNDTSMIPVDGSIASEIWSFSTEIWDVGPTAIIRPLPVSYAGSVIIPQVRVKNFGTGMIPSFPVTMMIGEIYTNTQIVTNLMPGDSMVVYFDPWTAVLGVYNMTAYTALEWDNNYANDTVRGVVDVQPPAHNVGTMAIISPEFDTTLAGTLIMPSARVKNFGAFVENFVVRFKIGTVYNESIAITDFPISAETTLTFPRWVATPCNYVISCSTELALDQLPEDDAVSTMLTVQYYDLGISSILAPSGYVMACNNYTPMVVVENNSVHTPPVLCTLVVQIVQYPAVMTSFCNIGRSEQGVVVYEAEYITDIENSTAIMMSQTWHPYWWDITQICDPTYHQVVAWIKTAFDMDSTNDYIANQFIVVGPEGDLQMNWTGLLDGYTPMHCETLDIKTYNVASVASAVTEIPENTPDFRAKVQIWKENTHSLVYARYLDEFIAPYVCLPFQSGFTPTEEGWYRVKSWLETRPGMDVIAENNIWERYYYFTSMLPTRVATNSNQTIQGNPALPATFALAQAYPNPFNEMTTIEWQLPVASEVSIAVYDALGRAVKTLASGTYQPGYHSINWNRTDNANQRVAAGIYFYEMRADKFISRQKLVIK
jgi:hypothetical protein